MHFEVSQLVLILQQLMYKKRKERKKASGCSTALSPNMQPCSVAAKETFTPILRDTTSSKTSRLWVAVTPLGSAVGKTRRQYCTQFLHYFRKRTNKPGSPEQSSRWQGHLPWARFAQKERVYWEALPLLSSQLGTCFPSHHPPWVFTTRKHPGLVPQNSTGCLHGGLEMVGVGVRPRRKRKVLTRVTELKWEGARQGDEGTRAKVQPAGPAESLETHVLAWEELRSGEIASNSKVQRWLWQ